MQCVFRVSENPISPLDKKQIGHKYMKGFIGRPLILFLNRRPHTGLAEGKHDSGSCLWSQPCSHGRGGVCLLRLHVPRGTSLLPEAQSHAVSTHYSCVNICSGENI